MATKKQGGAGVKGRKRMLTPKQEKFVEGVSRHGNKSKAAKEAGYAHPYNNAHRLMENDVIRENVERRRAEAMRRSQIHTDVIVGSLAEIATASLADVMPDDELLQRARELGTDHLIKKVKVKTRYYSNGPGKDPDKEVTHEYEMYSRLDALSQLRDAFGIKQEPRRNTADDVEEAIRQFKEEAKRLGHNISDEEARRYIEPRLIESPLVQ